ncbi:hypothetical protein M408DRAFT_319244 [Serendipita vermifera MAFF 305830]|uniref:Pali-domain-containing protein n=1 Tax=Serendipita vermifera MAFF 305830 TaxID=933852 RepID=A0A0C2WBR7_SERVB|nr:hypothetical protein M408DRAFT_319244 [Serendipita vermifera MAFF 305830]
MASRRLILGRVVLGVAFILSFLISISLPYVRFLDLVRTSYGTPRTIVTGTSNDQTTELRLGLWGVCSSLASSGDWKCWMGYNSSVGGKYIRESWVYGAEVHPLVTFVILLAWLLSFSLKTIFVAFVFTAIGCLLTFIWFAIEIAVFVHVTNQMGNIGGSTRPGPAFWMTLVVLILAVVAGCVVYLEHRRQKRKTEAGTTKTVRPWNYRPRRNRV